MDPDTNLARQLELARRIINAIDDGPDDTVTADELRKRIVDDAGELAEHVQALHGWMSSGGYSPAPWMAKARPLMWEREPVATLPVSSLRSRVRARMANEA